MKLSISNIAWPAAMDEQMYTALQERCFDGLEIAPTRLFPSHPYEHKDEAAQYSQMLRREYGLGISSMQSIWYGISENIFGSKESRQKLIDYTHEAIDFACALQCDNLVFGCPRNRSMPDVDCLPIAYEFFDQIGNYAFSRDVVIALEPNPGCYGTNFINTTAEAFAFCKNVGSAGLRVNIDVGTMVFHGESVELLLGDIGLVNHIHISEPMLVPIQKRDLHAALKSLPYQRYASIEMQNPDDLVTVLQAMDYVKEVLE